MEEIKFSKVEEIVICKVLLSQAFGQTVEFSTKVDTIILRLWDEFDGQTCIRVKLAGVLLLLAGRYGVGIAPVSQKRWGLYRFWTSNAMNYTYNLLRSSVFGETSVEQKICTLKQANYKRSSTLEKITRSPLFDHATISFIWCPSSESTRSHNSVSPLRLATDLVLESNPI